MRFDFDCLKQAVSHMEEEYPKEGCGLIVLKNGKQWWISCKNEHPSPTTAFRISPEKMRCAQWNDEVVAVLHSHPGQNEVVPSGSDISAQKAMGVPWVIIGVVDGKAANIRILEDAS